MGSFSKIMTISIKMGRKNHMPFKIAGTINGKVRTCKTMSDYQGEKQTLGEILLSASEITDEFIRRMI